MKYSLMLLLLFGCVVCVQHARAQVITQPLDYGWRFRMAGTDTWMHASRPGALVSDLFNLGEIVHPWLGSSDDTKVGSADWEYAINFDVEPGLFAHQQLELVVRGAQSAVEIYINNEAVDVLKTRDGTYSVGHNVKPKDNEILLVFHSSEAQEEPLAGLLGHIYLQGWSGALVRDVSLLGMHLSGEEARLSVQARVASAKTQYGELTFDIDGHTVFSTRVMIGHGTSDLHYDILIDKPERWWPAGEGAQKIYTLSAHLSGEDFTPSVDTLPVGLRSVQLMQNSDSLFSIMINEEAFYTKGVVFEEPLCLTNDCQPQYESLVQDALMAGFNTIILRSSAKKPELLYTLCDRYGLLVWQQLDQNETLEFGALQHHPSLALLFSYWHGEQTASARQIPKDQKAWIVPYLSHIKLNTTASAIGAIQLLDARASMPMMEGENVPAEAIAEMLTVHSSEYKDYAAQWRKAPDKNAYIEKTQRTQAAQLMEAIGRARLQSPLSRGLVLDRLNDTHPAIATSLLDFQRRKKAAYFAVQQALAPVLLSIQLTADSVKVYALHDGKGKLKAQLEVHLMDLSGKVEHQKKLNLTLPAGATELLYAEQLKEIKKNIEPAEHFIAARITAKDSVLASDRAFFRNPDKLSFPKPNLSLDYIIENGRLYLHVRSEASAHRLLLQSKSGKTNFSRNYLNLLPGDKTTIELDSPLTLKAVKDDISWTSEL
jgi:hypothetical protein